MASVQLGKPVRMTYLKHLCQDLVSADAKDLGLIMVNPQIVSRIGKTKYWESCMSCPGDFALVERPYAVVVEYYDLCAKS